MRCSAGEIQQGQAIDSTLLTQAQREELSRNE